MLGHFFFVKVETVKIYYAGGKDLLLRQQLLNLEGCIMFRQQLLNLEGSVIMLGLHSGTRRAESETFE